MNARDQQTIADYSGNGGNCVIFPYLPDREMSQQPCTIIRDALAVSPSGVEIIDSPLIDIFDLKDIKCANPLIVYSETSLAGAEIIARTLNGTACGFIKPLGAGSVIHLGSWIGFDTEGQKPVYEAILQQSGARLRQASTESDYIAVRERFTPQGSAMLFIGNYYNEEHTAKINYTHPGTCESIRIPYTQDEMLWPPLYGVLTPVCMEISDGLKLLHTTSDILNIEQQNGQLQITLYGDRDLPGEIVFEGEKSDNIDDAAIDGTRVRMVRDGKRVACTYIHAHRKEMTLTFKI
jgi:hypothetical protein